MGINIWKGAHLQKVAQKMFVVSETFLVQYI